MRALWVESKDGRTLATVKEVPDESLPAGEVLVRVSHSSLNYKDGLAVTGKGKVVKSYPFVPGIDLAGVVEESRSPAWKKGDPVVLTGWGVGERQWGGFAERARVKAEWLLRLPEGFTAEQTMAVGTAGLTAALAVIALEERGARPGGAPILVTGATGGVGSIAVVLLSGAGFKVAAVTGKPDAADLLREMGAAEILGRDEVSPPDARPLQEQRWGGAVDVVGGKVLEQILPQLAYGSSVAACGLAGGNAFEATVFPFILRGINLLGIESVNCPNPLRGKAWARIVSGLPPEILGRLTTVAPLEEVPRLSEQIVNGRLRGRTVIAI